MSTLVRLTFLETRCHYRINGELDGGGQGQGDEVGANRWAQDQTFEGQCAPT